MIIRGENVQDMALLSPLRELHFEKSQEKESFFEEECRKVFQEGFQSGEKKGFERASGEIKELLSLVQTLAQKLLEHTRNVVEHLKPEVIELTIVLCEKVIRKELESPQMLIHLIHSLLSSAPDLNQNEVKIRLSPEDFNMLEAFAQNKDLKGLNFQSDSLMMRGDCRIETESGLINYSIARELDFLKRKILKNE